MKILKWLLIVVLVIVLLFVGFLAYMGYFSTPKVTEQKIGPYTLVYEEYVGPYSNTGKVLTKVYNALKADKIETTKGFGIYLNDPKSTTPDKLHSLVGCVLEKKDEKKAWQLRKKYKVMTWKAKNCLVTEFPIKNDLSYMIGPMKAYPELNKAMQDKKVKLGACMELYDLPAKKTLFIFEVIK